MGIKIKLETTVMGLWILEKTGNYYNGFRDIGK